MPGFIGVPVESVDPQTGGILPLEVVEAIDADHSIGTEEIAGHPVCRGGRVAIIQLDHIGDYDYYEQGPHMFSTAEIRFWISAWFSFQRLVFPR